MSSPEILGTVEFSSHPLTESVDVRVRLEDTTMLDAPSIVIAETWCRIDPGSPARSNFSLSVPDEALDERRDYTLSAHSEGAGRAVRPRFGTVQSYRWSIGSGRPNRLELHKLDQD